MFTPERIEQEELLDGANVPLEEVMRSLDDLRAFNKFGGGIRIYRSLLRRLTGNDRSRKLRILDLGTGSSDLLDSLRKYAHLMPIGLDVKIEHLLHVRKGSPVRRVVGDAKHLPFRDSALDVVSSAHFFHHFSPDENVAILTESLRVAREGVFVSDLVRHHVLLAFVRLVGALRLVGRVTRFDAPASVLQSYTDAEVRELVQRVPASRREVVRRVPYRWGALLWK